MAYLFSNICTKNYWNLTTTVKIKVGDWVILDPSAAESSSRRCRRKKQWRAKPSEITSSRHRRKISGTHDNLFDKIISTVISFSIHTPIANSGAVVWQFFFHKSALCKQNL